MSKYGPQQNITATPQEKPKDIEWSIRDTEFLLRLLMSSKIDGSDIEVAASVITRIKAMHAKIVDYKVFT